MLIAAVAAVLPGRAVPVSAAAIQLPHVTVHQSRSLNCEAAALLMGLSTLGINDSQDWLMSLIPTDSRAAVVDHGTLIRWGDPYEAFVGDINGSEPAFTGYGVYNGPVAVAARKAGATAMSGSGWDPQSLYAEVLAGHPVIAWVLFGQIARATSYYRAFDGRMIPYAIGEHAVTVVGVDTGSGTVTIADPEIGVTKSISMGQFEASFAVLDRQAVVLGVSGQLGMVASPTGKGYSLLGADGTVHTFGDAVALGSLPAQTLPSPPVGVAATPTGKGYWITGKDGNVFPFGDAQSYGNETGTRLNQPIVGIAATPTGKGYWLVASDGGVFPFGDAGGYGSTGNLVLNQAVTGLAPTATGHGYWLVAGDGGIFPFGDAGGYGSTGDVRLTRPMIGMAATADGHGYWLFASDGGIFPFGNAPGYGSTGAIRLDSPMVSMAVSPSGAGYWLVTASGHIHVFGDAVNVGGLG